MILENKIGSIKKIMLYKSVEGIYLFLYDTIEDKPAKKDFWFEELEETEEFL